MTLIGNTPRGHSSIQFDTKSNRYSGFMKLPHAHSSHGGYCLSLLTITQATLSSKPASLGWFEEGKLKKEASLAMCADDWGRFPLRESVNLLGNYTAFRKTCSIRQVAVLLTLRMILALVESQATVLLRMNSQIRHRAIVFHTHRLRSRSDGDHLTAVL